MATIVTRATKGSALTWTEGDANIENLNTDKIELTDLSVSTTTKANGGSLSYNNTTGAFTFAPGGMNTYIRGKASESIAKGDVVMFAGVQGDHILIAKADATAVGFVSEWVVGVADQSLSTNDFGDIVTFGEVVDIDTATNYNEGDILYLDAATPGGMTATEPAAPNPKITIAAVTKEDATEGIILVRPLVRPKLSRLSDVDTTGITDGQMLVWDNANSKFIAGDASSVSAIDDLSDVDTTDIEANDLLIWDSANSKFVASSQLVRSMPMGVSGSVSAIDDQSSPQTISLSPGTGISQGDTITFSGSNVTSAGLSTEITYYIWAEQSAGVYEISADNNSAYDGLIDFGEITDLSFTTTPMSGGIYGVVLADLGDVNITAPTTGAALVYNSSNSTWEAGTINGGIQSVSEDTNPQLGGTLDVNGNSIVSSSDGDINITPDGSGKIVLDGLNWPTSDGSANQVLKTDGAGQLSWDTPSSGGNNIIILGSSGGTQFNCNSRASYGVITISSSYLVLDSAGGISGVSVNTTNKTVTLPAGTYIIEFPYSSFVNSSNTGDIEFAPYVNSSTKGTSVLVLSEYTDGTPVFVGPATAKFTIASSTTYGFYRTSGTLNEAILECNIGADTSKTYWCFKIYKIA